MRSAVFTFAAFAVIETQAHTFLRALTFQSCEVPRFEWAAHGNRVTGRMYGKGVLVLAAVVLRALPFHLSLG